MKRVLVVGASRGIGAALTQHFLHAGYQVLAVARTPPASASVMQGLAWLAADVSTQQGVQRVIEAVGGEPLDALVIASGMWERYGFRDDFDFRKTHARETHDIIQLNLVAPIEITKGVAAALRRAANPRAIYLGALSGVDQLASHQVAYSASKFGLRGAIQGLRKALSEEGVGFTVLNLGNVATEEVLADMEAGHFPPQTPIPLSAITAVVDMLLTLPPSVEMGDLNVMQKSDNAAATGAVCRSPVS